ncbi:hypothetical protein FHP25_18275 [Vineibacter terrae]|uniref:Uncharacterized protein n=1 Tax=Vineibacter terrae TaxID=2586908 RepID=A0A5C8PJX5_9HYPH|nr:hypothetical protein [Vineibacter terrae]TXL74148.1 hypothetical protein FHP25_18275 [Vineibacter terrae]
MISAPACLVRIGRRAVPVLVGAVAALLSIPALAQNPSFGQNAPMAPQGLPPAQNATAPREVAPPAPAPQAAPTAATSAGKRRSFDFSVPDFGSAPLRLDVARVEVVQAYAPPQQMPNVEHRMIVSPLATMDDWARRHIEAAAPGRDDSAAVFVIEDASVVTEKLRTRKGLIESLIREDSDKFTLRLAVTLQVRDRLGATVGSTSAEASAWRTVPESMKDSDRSAVWHELLIAAMDNLVPVFEANARAYLARFLK